MIDTREQLIHTLTEAAEVEHNLLCSYLYAAFSMKRPGEEGLTASHAEAVDRWRKTIMKIALEEMAHLACVNNLLLAIGGPPHFDRPNFPVAPGYHPADVVVRLTPFDEATLNHFIYLERPANVPMEDGLGFEASGAERVVPTGGVTPFAQDYGSIGALYDSIAEGFVTLAHRLGEATLIDCTGAGQIDSKAIKLPNIPRVTSLATAVLTIEQIKEEGEGSSSDGADSHYDRFLAIKAEWHALATVDPSFRPAWPAAQDPVMRKPIDGLERVWITEPLSAAYLDIANAIYGAMVGALTQAFSVASVDEQRLLMRVSVELMEASAAVSVALARMPATPEPSDPNAGITFTVPRTCGYRPYAKGSRGLFLERAHELHRAAAATLSGSTSEKALRRIENAIALLDGSAPSD